MSGEIINLDVDHGAIVIITRDMLAAGCNLDVAADAVLILLDAPPTAEQAAELIRAIKETPAKT